MHGKLGLNVCYLTLLIMIYSLMDLPGVDTRMQCFTPEPNSTKYEVKLYCLCIAEVLLVQRSVANKRSAVVHLCQPIVT